MSDPQPRQCRSLAAGIAARTGHAIGALCLLLFLVSLRWYALYRYQPRAPAQPPTTGPWRLTSAALGIGGGAVCIMRWYAPPSAFEPAAPNLLGWFSGRYDKPVIWWPEGFNKPHRYQACPIWMFALAGYTPRFMVALRDRARTRRRRCHACCYDLRGLPAGPEGTTTCPECGSLTPADRSAAR